MHENTPDVSLSVSLSRLSLSALSALSLAVSLSVSLSPSLFSLDSEPEIVRVVSKEASSPFANTSAARKKLKNESILLLDSELKRYRFRAGCVITAGDTVELKDYSTHEEDAMHSADFLHVKHIIMNLETDKVRLRGHRLRRCKYLGQIFDCE
jgi:DNA (cytosine-5)-methyltransferase 1